MVLVFLCLAWESWSSRKKHRKIDQAAKAPGGVAVPRDTTASPRDEPGEAPVFYQPSVSAEPAAGTVPIRCLECGAESAEATEICTRCGAPIALQRPPAADPAIGRRAGLPSARRGPLILAGVAIALLAASAGIAALVKATSSTGQLTEDQLKPGDCLTGSNLGLETSNPWPDLVTAVPCTQQHIAEVYFADNAWPQSLAAYPGDDAVGSTADNRCGNAFALYNGIPSDESAFTYTEIVPDGVTWPGGDRWLVCIAYESTDKYPGGAAVNYSIKNSNQ
jgi:hypothetical protein